MPGRELRAQRSNVKSTEVAPALDNAHYAASSKSTQLRRSAAPPRGRRDPAADCYEVIRCRSSIWLSGGGTIATGADVVRCDASIADGRITSLARDIADAREVIDASELLLMPGGSFRLLYGFCR
jgi:hypothetical protein